MLRLDLIVCFLPLNTTPNNLAPNLIYTDLPEDNTYAFISGHPLKTPPLLDHLSFHLPRLIFLYSLLASF